MLVSPFPYSTWNTYLGTRAQEHRINITSNNLANINTPGFKKEVPIFHGFMVKATKTDFSQGSFMQTENPLDLALSGPGFFQVETPNGVRYTRNGSFSRTAEGLLVSQEGHPIVADQEIIIPDDAIEINITEDGMVYADRILLGQIQLVEFEDPQVLAKEGYCNFVPKVDGVEGEPAQDTTVVQGCVEGSNVNPVMASVNMIDTLRTYEVFQKVVHSFQEIDQKTLNEVGRLI